MRKAALVYFAAAVLYTWPLALHPTTRLAAPVGIGDPYLNLWILGWGMQAVVERPMDVLTGRAFNANIFHPAESTLAYSDHLLPQSAALAPVYGLTRDAVLCYNLLFFASLLLSGLAMHAYVQGVVASTGGAYLAGLAWAFWPYRFAHLIHLQLQALYFLPIAFLFLHRLVAGRRTRDAILLGITMGLQALSSVYYAVIGGLALVIGAVALAIGVGRWRSRAIGGRLVLAALIGGALVAPVAWVYLQVQRGEGFGRGLYQAARNAATLDSYVQVPPQNLLYGRTGLLASGGAERDLFPGAVVIALACAGVVFGRRSDARPLVAAMTAIAVAGIVLSLGPDGFRDVYAFLQRYMFGFDAIRAPARFGVLVMFAFATLAALGWRELSLNRRGAIPLVTLIVIAGIEYLNVPMPLTPAPPRTTAVGQWLRNEPGPGAVVYLPIGIDVESTPAMVQSLEHGRPLVNGYSGQRPAYYTALVDSLGTFPGDEALLALNEIGVRFVVAPAPVPAPPDEAWPLVERARFSEAVIYELHWTPEIENRLAADLAVTPPPPGPAPFTAGETARYAVFWTSAGANLAAGEVTLSVEDPPYMFTGRLETAPWMDRFFETRATFTTRTDAALVPQVHERDERQGSRHVARTFLYHHEERLIRIGRDAADAAGAEAVTLPLAAAARDAVSAIFFARTLPLLPGDRYLIPVNEAGRNLIVELVVGPREQVMVQGREVRAIRLEPLMRRRVERRRPVAATLWISDDGRRVPVALDLDAPFGRVRAELVSYEPS